MRKRVFKNGRGYFLTTKMLTLSAALALSAGVFSVGGIDTYAAEEVGKNDTKEAATQINLNTDITGNLGSESDKDFYKFTVNERSVARVNFTNPYKNTSSGFLVKLFAEDDTVLFSEGIELSNMAVTKSDQIGLAPGTYYISVTQNQASYYPDIGTDNYTLKVDFSQDNNKEWEYEVNDSNTSANSIDLNKNTYGSISKGTDVDFYTFNVDNNATFSLTLGGEYYGTYCTWEANVYGPNGDEIDSVYITQGIIQDNAATRRLEKTSDEKKIEAGKYYVKVIGFHTGVKNTKYTLKLNVVYPNSQNDGTYRNLEWENVNGKSYWYENGVRQGTASDSKCFSYDGTLRGREIYDPNSDGWYWLDVNADGAKAVGKEVFMPYIYQNEKDWGEDEINSNAAASGADADGNYEHAELSEQVKNAIHNKSGKWVRYDNNGKMLKGWVKIEGELANLYPDQAGNVYYYDRKTGLMAKGMTVIGGTTYYFDEITGVLK